jgi:hypothetical protein
MFGTHAGKEESAGMRTLHTDATVTNEGTVTVQVSPEVEPGSKVGVYVIIHDTPGCESIEPLDLPSHDFGPWPEGLSLRRVDLYASNGR